MRTEERGGNIDVGGAQLTTWRRRGRADEVVRRGQWLPRGGTSGGFGEEGRPRGDPTEMRGWEYGIPACVAANIALSLCVPASVVAVRESHARAQLPMFFF
jgi:hypothetical protein